MPRIKILLAAEEGKDAQKLYRVLTQKHFEVDLAPDANRGKSLFETRCYALVLMVLPLPGANGAELCAYFHTKDKNIPIITLSPKGLDDALPPVCDGADDCLPLNYDTVELVSRVRALINRPSRMFYGLDTIEAGDIKLNLESKEVMRGSKLVMISAKEFQLLEYMVRNKNRVVTKTEMAVKILDGDSCLSLEKLSYCMNTLRKKIENIHLPRRIFTVSRKGYLLV